MIADPPRSRTTLAASLAFGRPVGRCAVELAAFTIALPLLIFPNRLSVVALVLLPLVWLARLAGPGAPARRSLADWPLVGLLLMTLVSLFPSVDLARSRVSLFGLILGFFVFGLLVTYLRSTAAAARLTGVLVAGGAVVAVVGLVGTNWIQSKFAFLAPLYVRLPHLATGVPGPAGAATSGFQPNEIAGTLDLLFPVALGLVLFARSPRIRFAAGGALLAMLGTLILTASRTGLAVALIVVVILGCARWRRVLFLVPVGLVGLGTCVALLGPDRVVGWLLAMGSSPGLDGSATTRLEIWNRAWLMIQDFPFTGIGLNTFPVVVNLLYPLFLSGPDANVPHAHDLYLQIALDLGLPGLACFVALVGVAGTSLYRAWRHSTGWERGLVAGLSASLVGHLCYGLTDAVVYGAKPAVFLWAVLGGSIALGLNARERSAHDQPAGLRRLWLEWILFTVACAMGLLIQLTGIEVLP